MKRYDWESLHHAGSLLHLTQAFTRWERIEPPGPHCFNSWYQRQAAFSMSFRRKADWTEGPVLGDHSWKQPAFREAVKQLAYLEYKDTPWAEGNQRGSKQRHRALEEALNLMALPGSQGTGEESLNKRKNHEKTWWAKNNTTIWF